MQRSSGGGGRQDDEIPKRKAIPSTVEKGGNRGEGPWSHFTQFAVRESGGLREFGIGKHKSLPFVVICDE